MHLSHLKIFSQIDLMLINKQRNAVINCGKLLSAPCQTYLWYYGTEHQFLFVSGKCCSRGGHWQNLECNQQAKEIAG